MRRKNFDIWTEFSLLLMSVSHTHTSSRLLKGQASEETEGSVRPLEFVAFGFELKREPVHSFKHQLPSRSHRVLPAERSAGSPAGRSRSRSEPRLRAEEGPEAEPTHPGRSVPRWGWSRGSRQTKTQAALRCGTSWIPGRPATRLEV